MPRGGSNGWKNKLGNLTETNRESCKLQTVVKWSGSTWSQHTEYNHRRNAAQTQANDRLLRMCDSVLVFLGVPKPTTPTIPNPRTIPRKHNQDSSGRYLVLPSTSPSCPGLLGGPCGLMVFSPVKLWDSSSTSMMVSPVSLSQIYQICSLCNLKGHRRRDLFVLSRFFTIYFPIVVPPPKM